MSTRTIALLLNSVAAVLVLTSPVDSPAASASASARPDRVRQGTLTVPSLKLRAVPVLAVGSVAGAVRVPRKSAVGWWRESVPFADDRGSSVLVGHVSDRRDRPGALYSLARIRRGATIRWRRGSTTRVFRVVRIQHTPRSAPVPRRIWTWRGRRTLHLVSCSRRVSRPGGFHYTHNVIVTARLVSEAPSRVMP